MILIFEQFFILTFYLEGPLQVLIATFEEDLVLVTSSFEVSEHLFFPINGLEGIFLGLEVVSSPIAFLSRLESTCDTLEASLRII